MANVKRTQYRTVADYLPLLANDRLSFLPATKWSYSNAGHTGGGPGTAVFVQFDKTTGLTSGRPKDWTQATGR